MKPDIFIDSNLAKNFSNPLDTAYKGLISWLFKRGVLVTNSKLIAEYNRCGASAYSGSSICAIVDRLTRDGRLNRIGTNDINGFRIPKRVSRNLRSNMLDRPHLKSVLLSDRKFALSADGDLRHDLNNYPGFQVIARKRPEDIEYYQ